MQHIHLADFGRRIRTLVEQSSSIVWASGAIDIGRPRRVSGLQNQRLSLPDRRRWGSCCVILDGVGTLIVSAMLGLVLQLDCGENAGSVGKLASVACREAEVHCLGEGCLQRDKKASRRLWYGCGDRIGIE